MWPKSALVKSCRFVVAGSLATAGVVGLAHFALAEDFPFEREMLLDARPIPGSRRVPILEIAPDGRAQIDLWCRSGEGRVAVAGDAISFTLGPMREQGCTPERVQRDEAMAAALAQVTRWRVDGDVVLLVGTETLRFRLSTH